MLIRSVHGSRLYGLEREDSDWDYWEVVQNKPKKRARSSKQTIKDGIDTTVMDLSTFSLYAEKAVPQILELMFSQKKELCLIEDYCNRFVANPVTVRQRYHDTIYAFSRRHQETPREPKTMRHVVRLAMNMEEMLTGEMRFNPTLSSSVAESLKASSVEQLEVWRDRILARLN